VSDLKSGNDRRPSEPKLLLFSPRSLSPIHPLFFYRKGNKKEKKFPAEIKKRHRLLFACAFFFSV
jgi:hypothetical protein